MEIKPHSYFPSKFLAQAKVYSIDPANAGHLIINSLCVAGTFYDVSMLEKVETSPAAATNHNVS